MNTSDQQLEAPPRSADNAPPAFTHLQSAHCESGVITSLLRHEGVPMTEAMAFGLTSSLSFCYFPLIKINQLPLISYRMMPRYILNGLRRLLKLPLRYETFRNPAGGRRRLDALLAQNRPVGMQGSVYFLPYFPVNMRFHFNAHNFIVFGRAPREANAAAEDPDYLVSDPVFNAPTRCAPGDLERARFVRGALAPKGLMYYMDAPVRIPDYAAAITPLLRGAIRKNVWMMLYMPLPFVSTYGINLLATRMRRLRTVENPDREFARRFVGHIVRMQEEVGTGGAGFRYLYAAFLQEGGAMMGRPALHDLSLELTAIGDDWRAFALQAARQNKGRVQLDPRALAAMLDAISRKERAFYKALWKAV